MDSTGVNSIKLDEQENTKNFIDKLIDKPKESNKIPFWYNNPNILFKFEYLTELFPTEDMTYEQKLNAISRGIIYLTVFIYLITMSFRVLVVGFISLLSVFVMFYYTSKKYKKQINENFENQADVVLSKYKLDKNEVFDKVDSSNPFGNVLIPDYEYNPNKKPAPPSFNTKVNDQILESAKKLVSELNPDQPDISEKLFTDLADNYVFEQSLRPFVSNPSTEIPNDQTGFAEFCYGSMISAKEGNLYSLARNLPRYNNY